jgi:hypothetical protein
MLETGYVMQELGFEGFKQDDSLKNRRIIIVLIVIGYI